MSIETWLAGRTGHDALGGQAERVVHVLARSPHFASYAAAREVAEQAGVHVSTVVRTAQQLGFDGWPDMRQELRAVYMAAAASGELDAAVRTDAATTMLRQDATNLARLTSDSNIESIRAIAQAIKSARRSVILSTGSGAGPAHILGYLGSILGYDIRVAVGPATTQAVEITQLDEQDCLIVVNIWRLTRALHGLTRMGHQQGATVAVITDLQSSPLNEHSHHTVITPIEGHDAMPSLTAMVATVQAVLAELLDADARANAGRVEQAWNALDLIDEQA